MTTRNFHKTIGLILLLPLLGWVTTAMVFYIKPGYAGAYELLEPKTYPLNERLSVSGMDSAWLEIRYVRTVLGLHVIARTKEGLVQFDPQTFQPRKQPGDEKLRILLNDAFTNNPARYGEVASISRDTAVTTTNVRVIFDWNGLTMYQRGADTDMIDMLYKIHYLQWTGVKALDRVLGPLGLALVVLLSTLGLRLAFKSVRTSVILKSE